MATEYYTTVTASDKFWNKLVSEKLETEYPISCICEDAGFSLTSKYYPAIIEIIELSNKIPEEHFNVIITMDNIYQNIIDYYEIHGGEARLIRSEPIFTFSISEDVRKNVDSTIIDDFKSEIIESLDRIGDFEPSYERVPEYQDPKWEMVTNVQFFYGYRDTILTARRMGSTYVKIELKPTRTILPGN